MSLLINKSKKGFTNKQFLANNKYTALNITDSRLRSHDLDLPRVPELEVIRHFTLLSQKNFSIDTHMYPLGSCTMKYNPKICLQASSLPNFLDRHPMSPDSSGQGYMHCLYHLQSILADAVGLPGVTLTPMAGAQSESIGLMMISAWHKKHGNTHKTEAIIPTSAHGTNPASAKICGFDIKEVDCKANGDIDIDHFKKLISDKTAAVLLTNPSTLGLFEREILEISKISKEYGALSYYDGANLNAILGKVRPSDMGFDIVHINLHKTFSTPHGTGGPGAGVIAVTEELKSYLPIPYIVKKDNKYRLASTADSEFSIGRLSCFNGNIGIILKAYAYVRTLGSDGCNRVSTYAVLNANYLAKKLSLLGYELAYPDRKASHEFVVTLANIKKQYGITALDLAKRLLDYNYHAPTIYFPTLIPECLLIEPTETESKDQLDGFIDAMAAIMQEIKTQPELLKHAPNNLRISRINEVKAAKDLNLTWATK